ncbi:NUDIX hydrolase domain-like protein [Mucor mucedo]|uniref:NUDIX hydrolase domain-like protein n=1 Tax=Mucor mucedo TaxID=29922 RepID=UPI00221F0B3E|nr:NUDIX hydrolase domain-like protein [Mucor mucedo]KAI7869592.1 NUDIX hydrolase domain-like protein [Mucor mucedo]
MTVFNTLLEAVAHCDNFPYVLDPKKEDDEMHRAIPFLLGAHTIGHVLPSVLVALKDYNQTTPVFTISDSSVQFNETVQTSQERTLAVKALMDSWRQNKTFDVLAGWRDELYPVYGDENEPDNIAFVMERASAALFGVSTFGVHLNAYIRNDQGEIFMWVARRALTKPTWPGLLDNCVAGGISYNYSVKETIVKECEEEASIPSHLASQARSVSLITYYTCSPGALQPETEYLFDLELPQDFKPIPRDGEAECFYLWPLQKVKETILNNEWKPNCALAAIDFFMRHSFITPDDEPEYIDISYRLHRRLEFPTPRRGLNR